ncbi:MAG TPA: hypothetical protein VEZ24_01065 [Microvirga sp.]|nr:hypothetical protein [Microvirga sp.]
MTINQVKELLGKGQLGELAATSYSQGVFDGLLAMEYLRRAETGEAREFCGIIDAERTGQPVNHPAFRTRELVLAWEKQGRSMAVGFPDLALNYLSAQYGCSNNPKSR